VVIMGACGAVFVTALVLGARWSSLPFQAPAPVDAPSVADVVRRFAWFCSLLLLSGVLTGITVVGTGGRLAMRLLAVTAGDDAQGRITEADEIVGEITVGGTIGFVLFVGIFTGVISAAVYLVVRRLLPRGWIGGLAFGAALLILLGTRGEPLRADNPDFDLVGPGWLSVLVFTALALAFGVALVGFVARLSAWLPLPSMDRRVLLRYAPIAVVGLAGFTITSTLVLVGVVVVVATRWPPLIRWVRSPTFVRVGRIAFVAIVVISLSGAVDTTADIISR
jgi:hypothetical protein